MERAASVVYAAMPPTPQFTWPLLNEQIGAEVWIKHENHTPVGAFKIRGSLVYFDQLRGSAKAVVTATRGNHGQAVAFGAGRAGLRSIVYVPQGNSGSKNAAMRALGADVVEFGSDFQAAREEALRRAQADDLHFVPSFHPVLVAGVATYALELFQSAPPLDAVYVPIGLGSGICGVAAAREALGLHTDIIGVVSDHARAYYESFVQRRAVPSPVSTELADGLACRIPEQAALEIIWRDVSRVITVTDAEVAEAMRRLFDATHNVAEGAGAAATAALFKDKARIRGKRVAAILTGGNVDANVYSAAIGR